jgi:hypothetical protein
MSRNAERPGFICAVAVLLMPLTLLAQNNRSFVATFGSDANNCTPSNECRSFARAIAVTNSGGEIIAVNSGGYGPFSIAKDIIVMAAPGAVAALTVTSGDGIDIGGVGHVVLRGLDITELDPYGAGISASGYGNVAIEDCSVAGGPIVIGYSGGYRPLAILTNTVVRNAGNGGFYAAGENIVLLRCRAEANGSAGLQVGGGSTPADVSAVDFVSVGNNDGVYVTSATPTGNGTLNLDHALISRNIFDGVVIDAVGYTGTATVRVTNSTVVDNGGYGFWNGGANTSFQSLRNNLVAGNGSGDTTGVITFISAN